MRQPPGWAELSPRPPEGTLTAFSSFQHYKAQSPGKDPSLFQPPAHDPGRARLQLERLPQGGCPSAARSCDTSLGLRTLSGEALPCTLPIPMTGFGAEGWRTWRHPWDWDVQGLHGEPGNKRGLPHSVPTPGTASPGMLPPPRLAFPQAWNNIHLSSLCFSWPKRVQRCTQLPNSPRSPPARAAWAGRDRRLPCGHFLGQECVTTPILLPFLGHRYPAPAALSASPRRRLH